MQSFTLCYFEHIRLNLGADCRRAPRRHATDTEPVRSRVRRELESTSTWDTTPYTQHDTQRRSVRAADQLQRIRCVFATQQMRTARSGCTVLEGQRSSLAEFRATSHSFIWGTQSTKTTKAPADREVPVHTTSCVEPHISSAPCARLLLGRLGHRRLILSRSGLHQR